MAKLLNYGRMAVNADGSFYIGNAENLPVSFSLDDSSNDISAIQLMMLLDTCIHNQFVPDLPDNICVGLLNISNSKCVILEGNWASIYGAF